MDNEKNIKKMWMNSLGFLDNCVVNTIIVVVLLLYSSTIFTNINMAVSSLYNFSIVKIIVLLLIIYVSKKDPTIAILLAMSYLVSINYVINNENFSSHSESDENIMKENIMKENIIKEKEHFFPMMNSTPFETENPVYKKNLKKMNSVQNNVDYPMVSQQMNESTNNNMQMNNMEMNNMGTNNMEMNNNMDSNNDTSCMQTYVPQFESISDVCEPTSTFKNEFNAQGLNNPEGFNSNISGSPLK